MDEKQRQFLLLRSSGKSFDYIAKELKISKPTAIQWSKLFKDDLNDMNFSALVALKEKYAFNVTTKYETLLKHLNKIDQAIESLDTSGATLRELMIFRNNLHMQIEKIEAGASYINSGLVTTDIFGKKSIEKIRLYEIE